MSDPVRLVVRDGVVYPAVAVAVLYAATSLVNVVFGNVIFALTFVTAVLWTALVGGVNLNFGFGGGDGDDGDDEHVDPFNPEPTPEDRGDDLSVPEDRLRALTFLSGVCILGWIVGLAPLFV